MAKSKQKQSEEQEREMARFVEKIMSLVPSEQQQAIFERAKSQRGRFVVNAGPGSGKTTTAIKASTYFEGKAIYLAFNRKIRLDTQQKLKALRSKVLPSTLHAFGLSCLQAYMRGKCVVDEDKYEKLADEYLNKQWNMFFDHFLEVHGNDLDEEDIPSRVDAHEWSLMLLHYVQMTLSDADEEDVLRGLIEQFDLVAINSAQPVWIFVSGMVADLVSSGTNEFLQTGKVSFDDMLYYPCVLSDVPVRTYDHIILDEAQDASKAGVGLMMRACHASTQVFAIGDEKQSIYAFAGADIDSIPNLIAAFHAEVLPLRVCYRCGTSIIELANQLDGQIIPAPNAHEGKVCVTGASDYLTMLESQDVVISRTTAPLVKDCLKVLQTGRRAMVLGRDLGRSIAAIVSRLEEMRVGRGQPALQRDLSNFAEVLGQYERNQKEQLAERASLKNKDAAISDLLDRIETVKAFYLAYISKCVDRSNIAAHDPECKFNRTAADFKQYIKGLFLDEDESGLILFMTAHRAKGGEWHRVFVIDTGNFPHPLAMSARQQIQERNLMYVAITRAIDELHFIGKPFAAVKVPGYEPEQAGLTIISVSAEGRAEHLEIYSEESLEDVDKLLDGEEVERSIYDEVGFEDYDPDVVETLFHDFLVEGQSDSLALSPASFSEMSDVGVVEANVVHVVEEPKVEEFEQIEGRVSRITAIEVLCPACNGLCVDRATKSAMITYDFVGHSVVCSTCGQVCIVPLNAFSLSGEVIAREKPTTGVTNSKREKKGRTKKEKKSNAGRKAKGGVVREPMQLSLDRRTIDVLNAMGVNKSQLFEELLKQYEPFLDVWAECGYDSSEEEDDEDEFNHDEMEDE